MDESEYTERVVNIGMRAWAVENVNAFIRANETRDEAKESIEKEFDRLKDTQKTNTK